MIAPEPRLRKFHYVTKGRHIMASAGARAYMGVWGLCPQWGPGAKPLVRGAKPPWSWRYIIKLEANFTLKLVSNSFKYWWLDLMWDSATTTYIHNENPSPHCWFHAPTASPQITEHTYLQKLEDTLPSYWMLNWELGLCSEKLAL
jgi:hypothetical protein